MEKKVPERKVSLRDEDIFYIYDKRINKCIKEGCEGTVKYGLVLRVSVSEEETINCFECNKCHMKYTPYPNYVRLSKTDMMTIYNQEEVTARDNKRAEDAAKQAAREKRKNGSKSFGNKSFEKKPYEKKPFEAKSYERKSYDKKPYERGSYEKGSYEKKPFERKPYERASYDNRNTEYKSSYGRKPYERTYENSYRSSYDKNASYDRTTSYDKTTSYDRDRKPYNRYAEGESRTYEAKPKNSKYGEVVYQGSSYKKKSNVVITNGNYKNSYKTGGYTARKDSGRQGYSGYQNRNQYDK